MRKACAKRLGSTRSGPTRGKSPLLGDARKCAPPTAHLQHQQQQQLAARGGGAVAGAAAAVGCGGVAAASSYEDEDALDDDDSEEEEETEEAQVLWSALFSCFPLVWAVITEFSAVAIEAGIFQYILLLMMPIFIALRNAVDYVQGVHPAPPAMAPPAPPPSPVGPDIATLVSDATFGFARTYPELYLFLDFFIAVVIGIIFLFLKDITEWLEAVRTAARQKQAGKANTPLYRKLRDANAKAAADEEAQRSAAIVDFDEKVFEEAEEAADEAVASVVDLQRELRNVEDRCAELGVMARGTSGSRTRMLRAYSLLLIARPAALW